MNGFESPQEWAVLFSKNLSSYVECICGHRVKRISYLYHKPTKTVKSIGKTCVKKYGITATVTNTILLDVTKEYCILSNKDNIDDIVREYILSKHSTFMTKIGGDVEIDYYDVVAPFRKLLTNVCDLVSEYGFDLVDLLRDIERDVECLNQTTRHTMVDEYDMDEYSLCDTISEIASEHYDEPEMPKDDEEFDVVCQEMIEKMYAEAGYVVPKIVYWNIHSRGDKNKPVQFDKQGTALVSGFSPALLTSLLGGKDMTPLSMMMDVIGSPRYSTVTI
jgi:uncharacterized protein YozE (UPF0346 family)